MLLRVGPVSAISGALPASVCELLADPSLVKTGVGVGADVRLVAEQLGAPSAGHVELQALAAREGVQAAGLAGLAKSVLAVHLDKDPALREHRPPNPGPCPRVPAHNHITRWAVPQGVATGRRRR